MDFYSWRLKLSLSAARETAAERTAPRTELDGAIARWRDAMTHERMMRSARYSEATLVPVRVPVNRPRR
jgi:hypothetical protein